MHPNTLSATGAQNPDEMTPNAGRVPRVDIIEAIESAYQKLMHKTAMRAGAIYLGGEAMRAFDDHPTVREGRRWANAVPISSARTWKGVPVYEVLDDPLHLHVSPRIEA